MDSAVLSVLVHASEDAASRHHAFAVVAPSKLAPTRLLAVTGIDKRLRIYHTRADAFSGLPASVTTTRTKGVRHANRGECAGWGT